MHIEYDYSSNRAEIIINGVCGPQIAETLFHFYCTKYYISHASKTPTNLQNVCGKTNKFVIDIETNVTYNLYFAENVF